MPLKRRPLARNDEVVRDASLIVIASEDTHAVEAYFHKFRPRRTQFRVLPTEDGRSSPGQVLDRLDQYRREYDFGDSDQFWVCLDSDHWLQSGHIENLRGVVRLCQQKQYGVAICNPCFEFWLLLHFREHSGGELEDCRAVVKALKGAAGGYRKDGVHKLEITPEMVHHARQRAQSLSGDTQEIPTEPAAQVHRILEALIQREAIDIKSSSGAN